ncbi:hypothetical protein [Methanobacterium spitsbergense]|uniref:Uncharacterized protein n=1 Tax=Methanobacterium spitsbergense TaxID=2874285 RepID=A0A8T5UQR0_9EURY|nr:hypothetical protein [Methanobacterium spitsbergense]MBZ2164467.1 hypothetical protein [Methanobacterium spitsbergense]
MVSFEEVTTLLLALFTLFLAYFTYNLAKESRKLREFQLKPKISISLFVDSPEPFLYLQIKNIGQVRAHNIKFKVIKDMEIIDGKFISDIDVINEGLEYLDVEDIKFYYLTNFKNRTDLLDKSFELEVKYRSIELDKTFMDTYPIRIIHYVWDLSQKNLKNYGFLEFLEK